MRQCLIITATIKPNSVMVSQNDVETRKQEYLNALHFYTQQYHLPIYFIENSGYNFDVDDDFQTIFQLSNVKLIQYQVSKEYSKGKGFQEFEILDQTISKLANKYDEFIKVSGRYIVTNFDELKLQKNNGFVIDRHRKKKVAITSFFICGSKEYFTYLAGSYQNVNDSEGVFIEHIVYQRLQKVDFKHIDIFKKNPIFKGVSGSYGGNLNRHPFKMKLINIERKLLKLLGKKELEFEY